MYGLHFAYLIPVIALIGAFGVGIVAMILRNQAKERQHRERMFMAEKGIEIPRELYDVPAPKPKPNGFRAGRAFLTVMGMLLIFIGIGVLIAISIRDGFSQGVNGLIPMFIGLGFLGAERMVARIDGKTGRE
jgi:hypothetical protein